MNTDTITLAQTLRQIAHETGLALLLRADAATVQRYANLYHDTCQNLLTLMPEAASFCTPLPAGASAGSIRLAARTAAAYVERLLPTDPEDSPMDTPIPNNTDIADALDTLADRLTEQDANPHRVQAYRLAAETVRHHEQSLADMLVSDGIEALKTLPWIGDSLASRIAGFVETGHLRLLENIRNEFQPKRLFTRVPGIGPELAQRLYDELGIETLEELEVAAHDGRLEDVEGFGRRRVRALRAQLNMMLGRQARRRANRIRASQPGRDHTSLLDDMPSVADLLNVDLEYRYRSARNELHRIAPRRFNPEGETWLPVLNTQRRPWRFTALFSNTARAHELEKTDDWVVIYAERSDEEQQYTVVTETRGELKGERVVRGREAECRTYYAERQTQAA